ncbi:MAG: PilZ domain-containing protein [Phycisphaeraceae bacterium]|nr:PilZ domain-containing protein [Phycisphaeraceae bacterium]
MSRTKERPANPVFDRRLFARTPVERGAKLFHRAGLSYAPGRTTDLSEGGALLEVHAARPMTPGDVVDVVIEPKVDAGVVRTRSLIEATVVRAVPLTGDLQVVAVRFTRNRSEFGRERLAA